MTDVTEDIHPVPVIVIGDESSREYAPELASWQSWQMLGTETGGAVFQILPQDSRRRKAKIYCIGTAGGVFLGSREQVMNGRGFALNVCNDVTVESQAGVWISGDGVNAVTVSVLDERYFK